MVRKVLVYRVEHEDTRLGLYSSRYKFDMNEKDRHPCPSQDPGLGEFYLQNIYHHAYNRDSPYFFGFASLDQLSSWIYKEEQIAELNATGFVIAIYQTDDYCIGNTQMVFRKSTARYVGDAEL